MTGANTSRTAALDTFLNQAADDLAQADSPPIGNDAEGLLFLGAWHQSYPAILVRDPFLSDSSKVHFLYLMQESSQKPHGAIAMPSLEETGRVLGHSRKTAGRDRMLLRVCRWVSLCRTVRDQGGRFRGSIYAIHSEPCSLADGNRLDRGYLELLNEASTHGDPYLQQAAQAAFDGIDQTLEDGRDPLDAPDPINRRLKAASAVQSGEGCFFDLLLTVGAKPSAASEPNSTDLPGGHPVATPNPEGGRVKFTHGQPCVNSTHGDSRPWVNFTHGNQVSVLYEQSKSYPQKEKFTRGYCSSSSSSSNKTTTTTEKASEEKFTHPPPGSALHWPSQFDEGQRAVIQRAMTNYAVPGDRQQEIIDVLAHKALDVDNQLRSPAGYAIKLAKRMKSGEFQPVKPPGSGGSRRANGAGLGHPKPDSAQAEMRDVRGQIREMQSEIAGLEQNLIPAAKEGSQATLEAVRDRYQQQLDELIQRYRALRGEVEPERSQSNG